MRTAVTTVLFDLGNTLSHIDHACVAEIITRHARSVSAAEVAVAEYQGKAAVDAEMRRRRSGTDETRRQPYFDAIMEALGVARDLRQTVADALRAEDTRATLWRVIHADTPAVLAALRARGYTLGVVSNSDGRVAAGLAACGLAPHFTAVIDSHVVGVEKPDARIFHLALQGCGARADETLFIGDIYEIDVRGARNAGITPLLLDPLGIYANVDCERIDRLGRLLERLPARPVPVPE